MLVRDIIKAAALQIGLYEEIVAYYAGEKADFKDEVALLLECFNHVENELALDYLPLHEEEQVAAAQGVIFYDSLKKKATRVIKVTDLSGESVAYQLFPTKLKVAPGEYRVRYAYAPSVKGLEDQTDFQLSVSERLFAYGIAAEYFLLKGAYQEASAWNVKYKEAVAAACHYKQSKRISSRRWV